MLTPATRTRPSTGALPMALRTVFPRRRPTGCGRPTLTERRRGMRPSYVSVDASDDMDGRLREAPAARPRRGARGGGRSPRHRRPVPAAVAAARHVEDAARRAARRARHRLRAPARARHAGRHALALPRRARRGGGGRLSRARRPRDAGGDRRARGRARCRAADGPAVPRGRPGRLPPARHHRRVARAPAEVARRRLVRSARVDRVLIAGGGIGGLALAGALGRRGVEVHVVDNQPEWSITRSGIVLQAPAVRALAALGLAGAVAEAGFGMTAFRYHDATSTQRASSELPRLAGPEHPGTIGILREPLHTILLGVAEDAGARVRLGTTVQTLDGPEVELTDGTSARYDLLVGADGIRSRVRELAFDGDAEPEYTGVVVWRALLDRPPAVDQFHLYNAPRATCGLCPVSEAQMYMFAVQPLPEFDRVPAEDEPALMRAVLQEFSGLAGELRDRIVDPEQVVRRPVEAILVPPPWHRARTVLIGDAVHAPPPTLAAGAAIALEDAVVLDEMLAAGGDVEATLGAFVDRRFERCKLVVEESVARTRGIIEPTPDFDVAAFERRVWAELPKPY